MTQNKEAPFNNYKYTGDNSRAKFDSNLKSNNENIKSTDKLYLAKGNDNGLLSTNHKSINSNSSIKKNSSGQMVSHESKEKPMSKFEGQYNTASKPNLNLEKCIDSINHSPSK